MNLQLEGRLALVTGSTAGIGFAIAKGLAAEARAAHERFPHLDILVNNLGVYQIKPFEQISDAGWQAIPAEMLQYGVTKTMQLALSRGLAETTSGTGVTVNSVLAGPTRSEGVERFVADMAKSRQITAAEVEREFFRSVRPPSTARRCGPMAGPCARSCRNATPRDTRSPPA